MEHTRDVGTARYMAPEIIFGPYNHMANVYSYALLVWETTHETIPFHYKHSIAAMILARSVVVKAPNRNVELNRSPIQKG